MRASEVGSFGEWLKTSPLADDRLWRRDLETVSNTELQLFYARAGLYGLKGNAVEAISRLQSALILAAVNGELTSKGALRLIGHEPPCERFDTDEFVDGLVKLSPARRAATLYALTARMAPEKVAELTWHEVAAMRQIHPQLREILASRAKVRHMKLPYVFWEWATEHIAVPLLKLGPTAEDAFGCTWPALQERFKTMLQISGRSDARSFISLVEEVAAGRV